MSNYFSILRNIELSTVYHIETQFNANWSNINIVKSFTNSYKVALPVICVRMAPITITVQEIGSTTQNLEPNIVIDIFASSDGQRIDLVASILNYLKDGWTYYEHSQTPGSPETLARVANGNIFVRDYISCYPLDFGEDVDKYDQHRFLIEVKVKKS